MSGSPRLDEAACLRALQGALQVRQRIHTEIRRFFGTRDYLEVNTPVRVRCPANEDHVHAERSGGGFLRTSPELHMKRLLGAGYERIFQLGPCFRQGERGRRHLPEFTMLEWYRAGTDCRGILQETKALVRQCVTAVCACGREERSARTCGPATSSARELNVHGEWQMLSVDDAFARYATTDVDTAVAEGCFEQQMLERVQPNLGYEQPVVLFDFPAALSSLAQGKPGDPSRVDRWELFSRGMEVANAYTELTDRAEQLERFQSSRRFRRAAGRDAYPVDDHYMDVLRRGMPECGGIAFGVDRFLMLLTGAEAIDEVVAFAGEFDEL